MNTLVHVRAPQCKLVEAYHPYMHRTTGLLELIAKIQQVIHVQAAFERYDRQFFSHVLCIPLPNHYRMGFSFYFASQIFVFLYTFLGILVIGGNEARPQYLQQADLRCVGLVFSLMFYFCRNLTNVTVSVSCGIVYSRGKGTPESEKKQTSVYLIKRKIEKKMLIYVPGTYTSPLVGALVGVVNSNPSSRERLILRTANPRPDSNSCVHC